MALTTLIVFFFSDAKSMRAVSGAVVQLATRTLETIAEERRSVMTCLVFPAVGEDGYRIVGDSDRNGNPPRIRAYWPDASHGPHRSLESMLRYLKNQMDTLDPGRRTRFAVAVLSDDTDAHLPCPDVLKRTAAAMWERGCRLVTVRFADKPGGKALADSLGFPPDSALDVAVDLGEDGGDQSRLHDEEATVRRLFDLLLGSRN